MKYITVIFLGLMSLSSMAQQEPGGDGSGDNGSGGNYENPFREGNVTGSPYGRDSAFENYGPDYSPEEKADRDRRLEQERADDARGGGRGGAPTYPPQQPTPCLSSDCPDQDDTSFFRFYIGH